MEKAMIRYAAKNYGTPSYIFDLDALKDRMEYIRENLGKNIGFCFAMKANPFIIKTLSALTERLEVCSPGEFSVCVKSNIPEEKLVISGVYKSEEDIRMMMENHPAIGTYTAESMRQWDALKKISKRYGRNIRVLLRLTSGNQFGMKGDEIKKIIGEHNDNIRISGIQFFSGTQKTSLKRLSRETEKLKELITELEADCGFVPFDGKLILELGRFICAPCGAYITKAVDIKTNQGQIYCITDGGMNHINYYGQSMAMRIPHSETLPDRSGEANHITVCGALCTSNDILVKHYPVKKIEIGDVFVFKNAGAYCMTEGISLFLTRALPQVLSYSRENGFRVLRSETPTDFLNTALI